MLVDTRTPPPSERPSWEPNWRLWRWVALAIAAFVASGATAGFVAYLCLCAALVFGCLAVGVATPSLDGLREHRQ